MLDSRIKKIVLTGGPCAGKSTILEEVEKHLKEQGYYVITLKETATQLINDNMPPLMDEERVLKFQEIVLRKQLEKERDAFLYASELLPNEKVVILCDRGVMDNRAYLETQEEFDYLLSKYGLDEQNVIHSYDMVIDLISTATAKKEYYILDGIREEPIEEAAVLDKKTTLAWITHPRLITIKPTDDIEEKEEKVINEVDKFLTGVEYSSRNCVTLNNKNDIDMVDGEDCRVLDISKMYLKDDLVLTHKKCADSAIMVLGKYNNSFDDRVISQAEAIELLYKKPIVFTETFRETSFVENGSIYKVIDNGKERYFEYDKSSTAYELNHAVDKINSKFVKVKK